MLKGKLLFQVDNQEFVLMPNSSINIPEGQFSNNNYYNNSLVPRPNHIIREPGDDGKNLIITDAYDYYFFLCTTGCIYCIRNTQHSRAEVYFYTHYTGNVPQ